MRHLALLLLTIAVAQASVSVTRTSNDGLHPSTMEIEVLLPDSTKKVRIPLARWNPLEDVPLTLVENGVSRTFSARQVHNPSHSHYRDVDSKSVISVRVVSGKRQVSGHVMHEGISYFLEPVVDSQHKVTARVKNPSRLAEVLDLVERRRVQSRRRRQTEMPKTNYTVELHLLIDSTVWSSFKKIYGTDTAALTELYFCYTHIMNGVDTAYRNIGTPSISVSCIGITISNSTGDDRWIPKDTLDGVAHLDQIMNYSQEKRLKADHVMAFTRRDIKDVSDSSPVGIAYPNAVCTDSGVSVIEDQGLHSWGTAAHELGHSLGSDHDVQPECNRKFLLAASPYSYTLKDVANSIRFSNCSIKAISEYIETLGTANCLQTAEASRLQETAKAGKEGARLTLDQVCRLSYPDTIGKFIPSEYNPDPSAICARILCVTPRGKFSELFEELRAPVGTPCGSRKSCNWDGHCTPDPTAPVADEACFFGDIKTAAYCTRLRTRIREGRKACTAYDKLRCCKTLAKGVCPKRAVPTS